MFNETLLLDPLVLVMDFIQKRETDMAKYEIMLVVSGSLDEKAASKVATEVTTSIKDCKAKVTEYGSKQLAYKIKNDLTGYYFQYNFECESPAAINEVRRLCNINKSILRSLIINLEKDYGYRASVNPKKVERNKKTAEIHAQKKAEIEKMKAARDAERMMGRPELESGEAKQEVKKPTRAKKETSEVADEAKPKKATTAKKPSTTKKTTSKKSSAE